MTTLVTSIFSSYRQYQKQKELQSKKAYDDLIEKQLDQKERPLFQTVVNKGSTFKIKKKPIILQDKLIELIDFIIEFGAKGLDVRVPEELEKDFEKEITKRNFVFLLLMTESSVCFGKITWYAVAKNKNILQAREDMR